MGKKVEKKVEGEAGWGNMYLAIMPDRVGDNRVYDKGALVDHCSE